MLAHMWADEGGMTSVEYAFLLGILSLAAVLAFSNLSTEVQGAVHRSADAIDTSPGTGCSGG